jgi:hypothetical protein
VVSVFRRWSGDPSHLRIIDECRDPNTYCHNFVLLGFASLLADAGLGSELVAPDPSSAGRVADMRVRLSARQWLDVDVKTPQTLQRLASVEVRTTDAERVVKSAIAACRGQFTNSGLLVVDGAFWSGDMDVHAEAVARRLAAPLGASASPAAWEHHEALVGVVLASTDIQYARSRGDSDFAGNWSEVDWSIAPHHRWVANPAY